MGATLNQWQWPSNVAGKVIGWAANGRELENKDHVSPADLAEIVLNAGRVVATRTVMKALDTTASTVAILKESGREGIFIWTVGDYSAQVTADTEEGVYVKATAIASTAGAWVRADHHEQINPEWLGGNVQAAVDLASALGWTTVYLTKDYVLPDDLEMLAGVKLFGVIAKRTLSAPTINYTGDLIDLATNSAHNCEFDNVIIDGRRGYGDELLTNGDFAGGSTGWTLGAGWTVGSGVATKAAGSASSLTQLIASPPANGTEVWVEYTISAYSAGTLTPKLTGGAGDVTGTARSADGTWVERLTVADDCDELSLAASSDFVGSVDAITLREPPASGTGRLIHMGAANYGKVVNSELVNSCQTGIQSADAIGWHIENNVFRNIPWCPVFMQCTTQRTVAGTNGKALVCRNKFHDFGGHAFQFNACNDVTAYENEAYADLTANFTASVSLAGVATWVSGPRGFTHADEGRFLVIWTGAIASEHRISKVMSSTSAVVTNPGTIATGPADIGTGDIMTLSGSGIDCNDNILEGGVTGGIVFTDAFAATTSASTCRIRGNRAKNIGQSAYSVQGTTCNRVDIDDNFANNVGVAVSCPPTVAVAVWISAAHTRYAARNNTLIDTQGVPTSQYIVRTGSFRGGSRVHGNTGLGVINGVDVLNGIQTVALTGFGASAAATGTKTDGEVVTFSVTIGAAPSANPSFILTSRVWKDGVAPIAHAQISTGTQVLCGIGTIGTGLMTVTLQGYTPVEAQVVTVRIRL